MRKTIQDRHKRPGITTDMMALALGMMTKSINVLSIQIASLQCDVNEIRTMMDQFVESAGADKTEYSADSKLNALITTAAVAQVTVHEDRLNLGYRADTTNNLNDCRGKRGVITRF